MEISEIGYTLLSIDEPKLHADMCGSLCALYVKVLAIFPDLEAARPRSTSGIQTLCALHMALEKTKNILQHCAECSKLYLALTGDAVVLKFEKARDVLVDSLGRIENIVPQAISSQIADILGEIGGIEFSLDPMEKEIGDEIIILLQQGRKFNNSSSDINELEPFQQVVSKLGITSSRAALRERRALKKLIEKARAEEDKKKESIISYLLHLMRKYSKLFRSEFSDDNDSQESTPRSPTVHGFLTDGGTVDHSGYGCAYHQQMPKLSSFNFKPILRRSDQMLVPPEELRCPLSLQLMYDPVIIASGQTYEKFWIEKWFSDGHDTCPKTQQHLPHLSLTPNYCVKGLVTNWCEQNGIPVPDGPPVSLDLSYWRLFLSEKDSKNSKFVGSMSPRKLKGVKVVPSNDSIVEEDVSAQHDDDEVCTFERYGDFLTTLKNDDDLMKKCNVVDQIRHLLKDDEEARIYIGANGFVKPLLCFLESAISARNAKAQEIGAMALFNLAVDSNRNKEMMLASGVLPILEKMITNTDSVRAATALYLNLSSLEAAKPTIGTTSEALSFLIQVLNHEKSVQCKLDALHTLYNISAHPSNIPHLLAADIIYTLQTIITHPSSHIWTKKCVAILIHLCSSQTARHEIINTPGLISGLATILDVGEPVEQEQVAACLLMLCNAEETCIQMVLQEGVIPSLVSISVNGTVRGKHKAQKLLMLFREQRQRDPPPDPTRTGSESGNVSLSAQDSKKQCKAMMGRKLGKGWSFWSKSKSFSVYQC